MSHIDITREHGVALKKGQKMLTAMADKLAEEYGATYEKTEEGLNFKGPGMEGSVVVDPKIIRIQASLGFLLRPMRSMIEKQIQAYLDEALKK